MKHAPEVRQLMTPRQVEEEYGIPFQTLANWRYLGRGPAYIKGPGRCARVKYRRVDIESWLDANRIDPQAVA